jgi:hypothetical protein
MKQKFNKGRTETSEPTVELSSNDRVSGRSVFVWVVRSCSVNVKFGLYAILLEKKALVRTAKCSGAFIIPTARYNLLATHLSPHRVIGDLSGHYQLEIKEIGDMVQDYLSNDKSRTIVMISPYDGILPGNHRCCPVSIGEVL